MHAHNSHIHPTACDEHHGAIGQMAGIPSSQLSDAWQRLCPAHHGLDDVLVILDLDESVFHPHLPTGHLGLWQGDLLISHSHFTNLFLRHASIGSIRGSPAETCGHGLHAFPGGLSAEGRLRKLEVRAGFSFPRQRGYTGQCALKHEIHGCTLMVQLPLSQCFQSLHHRLRLLCLRFRGLGRLRASSRRPADFGGGPGAKLALAMGKLAVPALCTPAKLHEVGTEPGLGVVWLLAQLRSAMRERAVRAPLACANRKELAKLRLLVHLQPLGFNVAQMILWAAMGLGNATMSSYSN